MAVGWFLRSVMRQQQRATAARGCTILIFFAALVTAGLLFGLPLLARVLPLIQKAH
jgi:hypothetical protein